MLVRISCRGVFDCKFFPASQVLNLRRSLFTERVLTSDTLGRSIPAT